MSKQYGAEEQSAWDLFFAAALPLAKAEGAAAGNNVAGSWAAVIKQAAGIADQMIEERRTTRRDPDPFTGKL